MMQRRRGFPVERDIVLYRGDTHLAARVWWVSLDLTGCTGKLQVENLQGALLVELTSPASGGLDIAPGVVPDPIPPGAPTTPWGRITMRLSEAQLEAIAAATGARYDLELTFPGGGKLTAFRGSMTVEQDVTRVRV